MRTRRINTFTMKVNTPYGAEFLALGDIHYGHPNCNIEKVKGYLDYCLKKHIYVLGMGDYLEAGTRVSIGGSVYEQSPNIQGQMDFIGDLFQPLAKKGLIIGLHSGNHSERIFNLTSINVVRLLAKQLGVRFLGEAQYHLLTVGSETYRVYSIHGRSNARLPQTKLLACRKLVDIASAELYLHGHLHTLETSASMYFDVSKRQKIQRTRHFCITGHFLEYEGSYAETMGMIPSRTGCPKILLHAGHHDIHISL